MTWRLQYAEELKKEIEYHRNKSMDYFGLLCKHKVKETSEQIDKLTNPFRSDNEYPKEIRYEYKVGDVIMRRWNFNIARIIKIEGDWYYFDRRGMSEITDCHTHVHKNSVEPEHCMRKVNIDLPIVTFKQEIEIDDATWIKQKG